METCTLTRRLCSNVRMGTTVNVPQANRRGYVEMQYTYRLGRTIIQGRRTLPAQPRSAYTYLRGLWGTVPTADLFVQLVKPPYNRLPTPQLPTVI